MLAAYSNAAPLCEGRHLAVTKLPFLLLISNVIQILPMPLIMVDQNVHGTHSELRAEHDLEVNVQPEEEIEVILRHLEYQNSMLIAMLSKLGVSVPEASARQGVTP